MKPGETNIDFNNTKKNGICNFCHMKYSKEKIGYHRRTFPYLGNIHPTSVHKYMICFLRTDTFGLP